MRRSVMLVVVVALATRIFAPVAVAQDDNPSADDRGMDDRSFDDRGVDDRRGGGPTFDDNPGADDRGFNDRGFDDNPTGADDVMTSPTANASDASGTASTPSASATATATATSGAGEDDVTTTSVSEVLPSTGGPSLVPLVSAATLVLLVGSGMVARRLVRRGR
jgi:cobalamin biosynthesis Mg chelatase CobN